jgi:O-antigen/teichoic acid export membrane protein
VTEPAQPDLGRRVVVGARWMLVLRLVSMTCAWVTTIALARLLTPSEYGLAGMALIALGVITIFQESGLRAALIHRRERIQEAVDAATAYTPFVGIFLCLLCVVGAPLAGLFFHRDEVTDLVRALGVVFLLRSISQVPSAVLERELMFARFTAVTVFGTVLELVVVLTLAASGAGAWSVIIGLIVLEACNALLLWPLCPLRPHPRRASMQELRSLLRYGRHMVGVNVSLFITTYVDMAVVGRFLGPAALGNYTLGFQTGKQAVSTVTYASNQVMFPAYAMLQEDPQRFRRAYLRSLRFITIISVPAGLGLAALSSEFIHVVYGEKWAPATPVLAIIALMGIVLSVSATMGEVLKAAGRPQLLFQTSSVQMALVVVTVLVAYRFGIAAVAGAVAVSMSVVALLAARYAGRILGLTPADWLRALWPSAVAGGIMVAGLVATKLAVATATSTDTLPMLVALSVEGCVLYAVALRLVARDEFRAVRGEFDRVLALSTIRSRLPGLSGL